MSARSASIEKGVFRCQSLERNVFLARKSLRIMRAEIVMLSFSGQILLKGVFTLPRFPHRPCAYGGGSTEDLHYSGEWLNYM